MLVHATRWFLSILGLASFLLLIGWSIGVVGPTEGIASVVLGVGSTILALAAARITFYLIIRHRILRELQFRQIAELGGTNEAYESFHWKPGSLLPLLRSLTRRRHHQFERVTCDSDGLDLLVSSIASSAVKLQLILCLVTDPTPGQELVQLRRDFMRKSEGIVSAQQAAALWTYLLRQKRLLAVIIRYRASSSAATLKSSIPVLEIAVVSDSWTPALTLGVTLPSPAQHFQELADGLRRRWIVLNGLVENPNVAAALIWLNPVASSKTLNGMPRPDPACESGQVWQGIDALSSVGAISEYGDLIRIADSGWNQLVRSYNLLRRISTQEAPSDVPCADLSGAFVLSELSGCSPPDYDLKECPLSLSGVVLAHAVTAHSKIPANIRRTEALFLWDRAQSYWPQLDERTRLGLIELTARNTTREAAERLWAAAIDPRRGDSYALGDAYITALASFPSDSVDPIVRQINTGIANSVADNSFASTPLEDQWSAVVLACHAAWLLPQLATARVTPGVSAQVLSDLSDAALAGNGCDVALQVSVAEGVRRALHSNPASFTKLKILIEQILTTNTSWLARQEVVRGLASTKGQWVAPFVELVRRMSQSRNEHFLVRTASQLLLDNRLAPSPSDYMALRSPIYYDLDPHEMVLIGGVATIVNLAEAVGTRAIQLGDRNGWKERRGALLHSHCLIRVMSNDSVVIRGLNFSEEVEMTQALRGRTIDSHLLLALSATRTSEMSYGGRGPWRQLRRLWSHLARDIGPEEL